MAGGGLYLTVLTGRRNCGGIDLQIKRSESVLGGREYPDVTCCKRRPRRGAPSTVCNTEKHAVEFEREKAIQVAEGGFQIIALEWHC